MKKPDEIVCIEVQYQDGSRCFVPRNEYILNPTIGSFSVTDSRKWTRYAFSYGMSAERIKNTILKNLNLSLEEAERLLDQYHKKEKDVS